MPTFRALLFLPLSLGCLGAGQGHPILLRGDKGGRKTTETGLGGAPDIACVTRFSPNPVQKTQVTTGTQTISAMQAGGAKPSNRPELAAPFRSLNIPRCEVRDGVAISPQASVHAALSLLPARLGRARKVSQARRADGY